MSAPDLSEFDKAAEISRHRSVKLGVIDLALNRLDSTEPDKSESLRAALNDPYTYPAPAIRRVMVGWGYEVSVTTIKTWRDRNVKNQDA